MRSVAECYRGNEVRVFRLERTALIASLRARSDRLLGETPEILEIRLFGSLAAGRAKPGSDADVWILLERDSRPFLQRSAALAVAFRGLGVGCDVLAFTDEEWRRLAAERRRLVAIVERDGVVLASRRSQTGLSPSSRSGPASSVGARSGG